MSRVETSLVRKQLLMAMDRSKLRAQQRRLRASDAEQSYGPFLNLTAIPVVKQLAQALRAEGYPFTVFTPSGSVRLASDHGREDYIELWLDTSSDPPLVAGRVNRVRGSRTLTSEGPVKADTGPAALSDEDVLTYFVNALEPWLER